MGMLRSAILATSVFVLCVSAERSLEAAPRHKHAAHPIMAYAGSANHVRFRYPASRGTADLVGDRDSGLGFYALPRQYRVAAQQSRRKGNAIRYAVANEAGLSYFNDEGLDGVDGAYAGRRRSTFNPIDGYGTPFFAGYYGPAGDPDAERGPFGQAYDD